MPVDIPPSIRVEERELVGRDPDHGSVPVVEREDIFREDPSDQLADEGDSGGAVEDGAGEPAERVEVEVVDDLGEGSNGKLAAIKCSSVSSQSSEEGSGGFFFLPRLRQR